MQYQGQIQVRSGSSPILSTLFYPCEHVGLRFLYLMHLAMFPHLHVLCVAADHKDGLSPTHTHLSFCQIILSIGYLIFVPLSLNKCRHPTTHLLLAGWAHARAGYADLPEWRKVSCAHHLLTFFFFWLSRRNLSHALRARASYPLPNFFTHTIYQLTYQI